MKILSKSPERHTFQQQTYHKIIADPEATQQKKDTAQAMIDFYGKHEQVTREVEMNDEWQKNNLEYDLRTTDWILQKARNSDGYAQNIYAALCNNEFIKKDTFQILKEDTWSCSWRHAGGIVADMRVEGDYIDWYCSGMGDGLGNGDKEGSKGYVGEGMITDEIRNDFERLGWLVWETKDDDSEQ